MDTTPQVIQIVQKLIGQPNNIVTTTSVSYDLQYIVSAILLIMTMFVIYGMLLSFVKNARIFKK